MRILTCVKYVPDAGDEVGFDADQRLTRNGPSSKLSELDEYAVEQALQLRAELGATVTVLSVGPAEAEVALRKALQMGADEAVLISDEAIAGSDVFGTASVLLAAAAHLGEVGLVMCGMSSPDAGVGVLPALLADGLGWPLLSNGAEVSVTGDVARIVRVDELGTRVVEAALPAVVSVTDQSGEPRYPSFKDVLAAKKKSVTTLSLADLGLGAASVGAGAARVEVVSVVRNPERAAGRVIVDVDGSSVDEIVEFLASATK